ncbi:hypothetical protein GCM10009559_12520 [Pseudonocardia zijingensis]|uniref:Uncharacterized protein n=1 Tax=Pseudonocardia zijingensis TaxID=153376 RepID=A0ABN1PFQ4_9PSEU
MGVAPTSRRNTDRKFAAVPNPVAAAMRSTDQSDTSRSRRALSSRCCVTHRSGGTPVSCTNRRMNVRRDSRLRSAICCTVIGDARFSSSHSRVAARSSRAGAGTVVYCGSVAARAGDTTSLATSSAAAAPKSLRTTCRHASTPALAPAEVSTFPSSTSSRFSSTSTPGQAARSSSAWRQCVVTLVTPATPQAASANTPVQTATMRAPRSAARRSASRYGCGTGRCGSS